MSNAQHQNIPENTYPAYLFSDDFLEKPHENRAQYVLNEIAAYFNTCASLNHSSDSQVTFRQSDVLEEVYTSNEEHYFKNKDLGVMGNFVCKTTYSRPYLEDCNTAFTAESRDIQSCLLIDLNTMKRIKVAFNHISKDYKLSVNNIDQQSLALYKSMFSI